jgi:predicted nucleic acid-binding protein
MAKCYLNEPGSDTVRSLASQSPSIATCELTRAELPAVFHRHLREGRLNKRACAIVFEQFHADIEAGVWEWLPLDERLWAEIDRCFRDLAETVFLRGADAVHLACARQHRIKEIYTSDRHMLAACEALDLLGCNPIRPGS